MWSHSPTGEKGYLEVEKKGEGFPVDFAHHCPRQPLPGRFKWNPENLSQLPEQLCIQPGDLSKVPEIQSEEQISLLWGLAVFWGF